MNDIQARAMFKSVLNKHIKRTDMKILTLSKLIGVSNSQIVRWTQGDMMPDWRQFNRILDIFGIESEDILGNSVSESSYTKRFK